MTKCMKCGVYIADNTDKCPLCQQVVAPVELSSDNHQGTEGFLNSTVRDTLMSRAHQENTDYWKYYIVFVYSGTDCADNC